MFFKKLFEIWTGQSLYNEMLAEFLSMIDLCAEMFGYLHDFFVGEKKPLKYKSRIFKSDKKINRSERTIRKQIIEHLTVNPGEDLAACLVLMSVVKDAERIGDYCKNMWEATHYYGKPIAEDVDPECFKLLDELTAAMNNVFTLTRDAFKASDSSIADDAIQCSNEIAVRCDGVIENLFDTEIPTKQAVVLTLFSRYMKRIAAHLGNISSTVILPLHKIDFPDKTSHKGELQRDSDRLACAELQKGREDSDDDNDDDDDDDDNDNGRDDD